MRWGIVLVATVLVAGCGGGGASSPTATPDDAGEPNRIELPAPAGTEEGRTVAMNSGCLACHRIGSSGNDGPGQDLTHVGGRLDRPAIERMLRTPPSPMPSFSALPKEKFSALVDYLTALR